MIAGAVALCIAVAGVVQADPIDGLARASETSSSVSLVSRCSAGRSVCGADTAFPSLALWGREPS
jgi:hypothetical protein